MKVIKNLKLVNHLDTPIAITIGNFDGIHPGHRHVLRKVKEIGNSSVVITFENHPAEVLKPGFKPCRLCTLNHKIRLIEEEGMTLLILLTFTEAFARQAPEEFLRTLKEAIPFTHLILGHDATIGKNKSGNAEVVSHLAEDMGFHLEYLEPYTHEGHVISSSLIRKNIQSGNLKEAEKLLGRKYSIFSLVEYGQGHGKKIGFPTINVNIDGLCTPPLGVYAVDVQIAGTLYQGIANLGVAPTIREPSKPILEVHLFEHNQEHYGKEVEVFFKQFIRPEIRFENVEALTQQINKDVVQAKTDKSLD